MNERDLNTIHDYFNGLLGPDEASQVETRAQTDTEFGDAFRLQQELEDFPKSQANRIALKNTLNQIGQDYFSESDAAQTVVAPTMTAKSNMRRWMALAASLTVLAAAVWFFLKPEANLYEQYAQHAPLALTERSNTPQEDMAAAESAFQQKKYDAALNALERVLNNQPDNLTAQLYKGICLIELGKSSDARQALAPMAAGSSALVDEARWYIALSYLKENNKAACAEALRQVSPASDRGRDAAALLAALK